MSILICLTLAIQEYKFPADAKSVELRADAPRERAYLGISPGEQSEEQAGVVLGDVPSDGPAAQGGLRAGDRVVKFAGEEVKDYNALVRMIQARKPGETVEVVAEREGEEQAFAVKLGGRAASGGFGMTIWKKPEFKLGLVLFEFPDCEHNPKFRREDFENLLFGRGTYTGKNPSGDRVYGSLADYYWENSDGKLTVTGKVFDWVKLEEARSYFEDKPMGHREAAKKLLPRVIELVQERDGADCFDGLDGIILLYAGKQTYKRPLMLWPHRASIRVGKKSVPYYLTAEGGKYFNAINVHVHEFGHMLGLPDQYGQKHATGIGKWCTMAVGHMGSGESRVHRPHHLCLWCKEQLGWAKVTTVAAAEGQWLKLAAIQKDPSMALRIPLENGEALLLENRQRHGFDSEIEGTGLLIWRVRRGGGVDLVEAHGRAVPNASLVDVEEIPWPSLYNRDYTPGTTPASPAGVFVTDIEERDGVVYFKVGIEKKAGTRGLDKRTDY